MTKLSAAVPAQSFRYQPYHAYYSALGAWRGRDQEQLRSSVLVAGSPRSGTTWLAAMIAGLAGWPLLDEPTHMHRVEEMWHGHNWMARPFREPQASDPELAADLERLLTGSYLGPGLVGRSRKIDGALWRRSPVVAKVIDSNFILPWITASLPWLRTIHMVRHPLAVVASQEARVGSYWSTQRTMGPAYQEFMAAHPEYAGPVEFDTVATCLVSVWAIEQAWVRDRFDDLHGTIHLRYESVRRDVAGEIGRVAAQLGLEPPTPDLLAKLDRPSRSVNKLENTLEADAQSGWRSRYDDAELSRLRAILERYDYPFYGPDEL